ncbi:MAG: inositol monophosphatase, monophosphatase [Candidatus Saccharibacteria bacterium]|nr:inositol monophosphatase, monophosphatase [Candidatus Saccharibacteria bacterium]
MPLSSREITGSLKLIIDTFKELRPELMRYYGNIDHTSKEDDSPVTELDVRVETILKERLAKEYPHIGFHGEETDDLPSASGATWIVDPIDGTLSFMHGLPYCTNMAGLVVDGEAVAAAIYQFPSDDLYTAVKGEGAYKNSEKISVKNTPLDDSLVFAGSFVYKNLYSLLKPHKIGVSAPIGASGYEFTRLAQGSIQGVTKLRCHSKMHDDVPGVLIAREAGAKVISFEAEEYTYEAVSFVIGTPNLMNVIEEHYDAIYEIIAT